MLVFYKKYYKTIFDIALIALTVFLIMWTFSYIYKIATPIFFAFIVFMIIEPIAKFLHRRKIKKSIASAIAILVFSLVILGALVGTGVIFATQISYLADKMPYYSKILQEEFSKNADFLHGKLELLPPSIADSIPYWTEKLKEYMEFLVSKGADIAAWGLGKIAGAVSSFSTFIINFLIGIILAYFLSIEIDFWKRIASEKTPKTFKNAFYFLKENVLKGIFGYLKAQFKLISITFVVIFIALLLLRVENAFAISLLSAIFDLLPLLGVSTVFIPWIIYLFIVGQTTLAIFLSVLLGAVILTRQILDPKITGDTLGVSAFTMLSFMIISLSLFGISGLILSPILIILLKELYVQGYLKEWIRIPEDEFDDEPKPPKPPTVHPAD